MGGTYTQEVQLLGQPTLQDHLNFIRSSVVGGESMDRRQLVDEWRQANDRYGELEDAEEGLADKIDVSNLDPALQTLTEEVMEDPYYTYTFDKLPTRFAMVELDKLVIYQTFINVEFSAILQDRLGTQPEPEALFRFCMPPSVPDDAVQIRRMGSRRFTFTSESTDFRAHQPTVLTPEQVNGFRTFGPVSGMVGLGVGFGSNFLTGIQVDDRVLLHNGYHRVHAMRSLGITHAPCILQRATRMDELELAAKRSVHTDSDFYFGTSRPPLLKDFFDDRFRRQYEVYRTLKVVEVNFEIKDYQVRI